MTRDKFIEKYSGKHYGDAKSLENKLAEMAGAIYDAMFKDATPVDGVKAEVTIDMTDDDADLIYTAKNYGTDGDSITVTHVNPSDDDAELFVTVDGTDIIISLGTDNGGAIDSTATEVKAAVDANAEAAALVDVAVEDDGEGVVNEKAKESLAGGVNVTEGIVGSAAFDDTNFYVKYSEQVWKEVAHDALT
jgi:hypothetical protein